MFKEFRAFIMRGNVMDLAVAVIIGGAFGKIITSLVSDIIMPVIGLVLGGISFADRFISLNGQAYATLAEAQKAGAATLNYGLFLNAVIDFIIIAFVIFMIIRAINRIMPPPPPPASTTRECPYCLSNIPKAASRCSSCTSQLEPVKG